MYINKSDKFYPYRPFRYLFFLPFSFSIDLYRESIRDRGRRGEKKRKRKREKNVGSLDLQTIATTIIHREYDRLVLSKRRNESRLPESPYSNPVFHSKHQIEFSYKTSVRICLPNRPPSSYGRSYRHGETIYLGCRKNL